MMVMMLMAAPESSCVFGIQLSMMRIEDVTSTVMMIVIQ